MPPPTVWRERLAALLGVSAYTSPSGGYGPDIGSDSVTSIRAALGGNLSPLPTTQLRWYLADLEEAQHAADAGDLSRVAQLLRAMRRDGMLSGLLGTLTGGVVGLTKKFYGDAAPVGALKAHNGSRSVFDDMCPPAELALLAGDGRMLGVGVAELLPVAGRDFPVLVRLDPQWLRYRWSENRWYYLSIAGPLPITPGDGRWVLHTPGGRQAPWQSGLWPACGRAFINKEHALLHRSNYSAKLANPARAATAPAGATETQRQGFLERVIAWGINTVFELPPGWDVKLIESNGRGFEVFQEEISSSDLEYMVAIAGQVVTTTGGTGFSNADVHQSIRADIIKDVAAALAYTVNTQILPAWTAARWGIDAIATGPAIEWDVAQPRDMQVEASSMVTVATAITSLSTALAPFSRAIDVDELTTRFGIPIAGDVDGDGTPDVATPEQAIVDVDSEPDDLGDEADAGASPEGALASVVQLRRVS